MPLLLCTKIPNQFPKAEKSSDSCASSILENEKGRDKILCEVQRNEANLTDVYLMCVFAH